MDFTTNFRRGLTGETGRVAVPALAGDQHHTRHRAGHASTSLVFHRIVARGASQTEVLGSLAGAAGDVAWLTSAADQQEGLVVVAGHARALVDHLGDYTRGALIVGGSRAVVAAGVAPAALGGRAVVEDAVVVAAVETGVVPGEVPVGADAAGAVGGRQAAAVAGRGAVLADIVCVEVLGGCTCSNRYTVGWVIS